MSQRIAEADGRAAEIGKVIRSDVRMARALLGAAESFESFDGAERELAAIALLRQAAVFAADGYLRRQKVDITESVERTWNAALEQPELNRLAQGFSADTRERMRCAVSVGLTSEYDTWSAAELRSLGASLKRLVHGMVNRVEDEILQPRRLRFQRIVRWVALVGAVAFGVSWCVDQIRSASATTNIALDKKVSISSNWRESEYPPSRLVDGDATQVGCHSESQDHPWVQIDLGSRRPIHRMVVVNRLDGLTDRAVPLLVETSSDGKDYKEYARQTVDFKTWNVKGPSTKARYVRLTILGQAILHLNEVEIY
jgi:hypothetical protein